MTELDKGKEFEFLESLTAELSSKELLFPTSSNVTMKIRHALNDANTSSEKIARIIGAEPVLSAQILRLANSAAFSRGNPPTFDLRQATLRLGFDLVRNVALAVCMKQLAQTQNNAAGPNLVDGLWNRSIRVAALSYVMARRLTRVPPDTAMIAGLLHDIGKFYILSRAQSFPAAVADMDALWDVVDRWHLNIGAVVLENWEVSDEIRAAVLDHREFDRVHPGAADLTDVVLAADILDADFYPDREPQIDWETPPYALVLLGLNQQTGKELMVDRKEEMDLVFQALS
ncbi:MAG: HDOD domain-containing protein [Burkholderiaceae bacterium]|nr:HDOD domain-containing protein [Burkholderiaceae bacterium]